MTIGRAHPLARVECETASEWLVSQIVFDSFWWEGLETVPEAVTRLGHKDAQDALRNPARRSNGEHVVSFLRNFSTAHALVRAVGWNGDYRTGTEARVWWLPAHLSRACAFVWKDDMERRAFVATLGPLAFPEPLRLTIPR